MAEDMGIAFEADGLDYLEGQPADIAPSAYRYRADRMRHENPPEAEFLFRAIGHERTGVLCGLLWEEPVIVMTG